MKVVFVSNFLNHHQIPFCDILENLCDEFFFISTQKGESQGYQVSCNRTYEIDYNLQKEYAEKLIVNADAVIFGACPTSLVELRMNNNKLSFIYSERFFKKGTWRRFIPRTRKAITQRIVRYKNANLFVLCASAYLSYDLLFFGFPESKCFKWGYFPETNVTRESESNLKESNSILWAGRFLKLKHPETPVKIAQYLKLHKIPFKMNLVGDGEEKSKIEALIKRYNLQNEVKLLGSKTHKEVLELMQQHKIYLFTSDFREGWGAVLNEAMASGCAVVASHAIGSVPFLINDGVNGAIYQYGDDYAAKAIVKQLIENNETSINYSEKAIKTIANYDYKTAAARLVEFISEYLANGNIKKYDDGILSRAYVIKNNWKGK